MVFKIQYAYTVKGRVVQNTKYVTPQRLEWHMKKLKKLKATTKISIMR